MKKNTRQTDIDFVGNLFAAVHNDDNNDDSDDDDYYYNNPYFLSRSAS